MTTTKLKFLAMTPIKEDKEMRKFSVVFRNSATGKLFGLVITHEELIQLMNEDGDTSLEVCVVREIG